MSFLDITINKKYRSSDSENIAKAFIENTLSESVCYKRAVGFFSSSSLIYTSRGLANIAKYYKGGTPIIQYVVSPRLTKDDINAITQGYKTRKAIVEEAIVRDFKDVDDFYGAERLNMISNLIAKGIMDIKIAIAEDGDDIGMFHEKIGVLYDADGRKVAFCGSLNESINAYVNNFESIRVFKSWTESSEDCEDIEQDFEDLWRDNTKKVQIYSFPEAAKQKLFKYRKETFDQFIDEHEDQAKNREQPKLPPASIYPCIPDSISLYDYQKEAIKKWIKSGAVGIFDMATGTGKTYTAYGAIVTLLKRAKYKLATIILCPYQHLVEQWVEDMPNFNINNPIIGYSSRKYYSYISKLKKAVQDYNDEIIDNFFFICTNATFKLDKVQDVLNGLKKRVLLVADEAHNLGTKEMGKFLIKDRYQYRLALSATFDRYRDEEGTSQIYNFFGNKCIEYSMERAIIENKLAKYYYYPRVSLLNDEEIKEYIELSKQIKKNAYPGKNGKIELTQTGKMLAIKRARVVAAAEDKIETLKEEIRNHKNEKNILVYCGTSRLENDNGEEIKQIDKVSRMLGYDFDMAIGRYTSTEKPEERIQIKERFEKGDLQALVAIKCLDEGVNIPGIKTAFLLASTTNPREYIQRRGRVLRKSQGKNFAIIYDFITLPCQLNTISNLSEETIQEFKSLAKNEISRMTEFANLSLNKSESDGLIDDITDKFNLNKFEIHDDFDIIDWNEGAYE